MPSYGGKKTTPSVKPRGMDDHVRRMKALRGEPIAPVDTPKYTTRFKKQQELAKIMAKHTSAVTTWKKSFSPSCDRRPTTVLLKKALLFPTGGNGEQSACDEMKLTSACTVSKARSCDHESTSSKACIQGRYGAVNKASTKGGQRTMSNTSTQGRDGAVSNVSTQGRDGAVNKASTQGSDGAVSNASTQDRVGFWSESSRSEQESAMRAGTTGKCSNQGRADSMSKDSTQGRHGTMSNTSTQNRDGTSRESSSYDQKRSMSIASAQNQDFTMDKVNSQSQEGTISAASRRELETAMRQASTQGREGTKGKASNQSQLCLLSESSSCDQERSMTIARTQNQDCTMSKVNSLSQEGTMSAASRRELETAERQASTHGQEGTKGKASNQCRAYSLSESSSCDQERSMTIARTQNQDCPMSKANSQSQEGTISAASRRELGTAMRQASTQGREGTKGKASNQSQLCSLSESSSCDKERSMTIARTQNQDCTMSKAHSQSQDGTMSGASRRELETAERQASTEGREGTKGKASNKSRVYSLSESSSCDQERSMTIDRTQNQDCTMSKVNSLSQEGTTSEASRGEQGTAMRQASTQGREGTKGKASNQSQVGSLSESSSCDQEISISIASAQIQDCTMSKVNSLGQEGTMSAASRRELETAERQASTHGQEGTTGKASNQSRVYSLSESSICGQERSMTIARTQNQDCPMSKANSQSQEGTISAASRRELGTAMRQASTQGREGTKDKASNQSQLCSLSESSSCDQERSMTIARTQNQDCAMSKVNSQSQEGTTSEASRGEQGTAKRQASTQGREGTKGKASNQSQLCLLSESSSCDQERSMTIASAQNQDCTMSKVNSLSQEDTMSEASRGEQGTAMRRASTHGREGTKGKASNQSQVGTLSKSSSCDQEISVSKASTQGREVTTSRAYTKGHEGNSNIYLGVMATSCGSSGSNGTKCVRSLSDNVDVSRNQCSTESMVELDIAHGHQTEHNITLNHQIEHDVIPDHQFEDYITPDHQAVLDNIPDHQANTRSDYLTAVDAESTKKISQDILSDKAHSNELSPNAKQLMRELCRRVEIVEETLDNLSAPVSTESAAVSVQSFFADNDNNEQDALEKQEVTALEPPTNMISKGKSLKVYSKTVSSEYEDLSVLSDQGLSSLPDDDEEFPETAYHGNPVADNKLLVPLYPGVDEKLAVKMIDWEFRNAMKSTSPLPLMKSTAVSPRYIADTQRRSGLQIVSDEYVYENPSSISMVSPYYYKSPGENDKEESLNTPDTYSHKKRKLKNRKPKDKTHSAYHKNRQCSEKLTPHQTADEPYEQHTCLTCKTKIILRDTGTQYNNVNPSAQTFCHVPEDLRIGKNYDWPYIQTNNSARDTEEGEEHPPATPDTSFDHEDDAKDRIRYTPQIDALKQQLDFQFAQLKKSTLIKTNISGKALQLSDSESSLNDLRESIDSLIATFEQEIQSVAGSPLMKNTSDLRRKVLATAHQRKAASSKLSAEKSSLDLQSISSTKSENCLLSRPPTSWENKEFEMSTSQPSPSKRRNSDEMSHKEYDGEWSRLKEFEAVNNSLNSSEGRAINNQRQTSSRSSGVERTKVNSFSNDCVNNPASYNHTDKRSTPRVEIFKPAIKTDTYTVLQTYCNSEQLVDDPQILNIPTPVRAYTPMFAAARNSLDTYRALLSEPTLHNDQQVLRQHNNECRKKVNFTIQPTYESQLDQNMSQLLPPLTKRKARVSAACPFTSSNENIPFNPKATTDKEVGHANHSVNSKNLLVKNRTTRYSKHYHCTGTAICNLDLEVREAERSHNIHPIWRQKETTTAMRQTQSDISGDVIRASASKSFIAKASRIPVRTSEDTNQGCHQSGFLPHPPSQPKPSKMSLLTKLRKVKSKMVSKF